MTFIDWSDPEEMLGLLLEYVADEVLVPENDGDRSDFLRRLLRDLEVASGREFAAVDQIAHQLEEIRDMQSRDFLTDPVIAHLDACIEELRRIGNVPASGRESGTS